tara:strand:+ start:580 stop:1794 length:1215 start_codon:yes stop_codon:yes gene_type:complete
MKPVRTIVQIVGALLVLGVAIVAALILLKTAPKVEPEEEKQAAKIVQVIDLRPSNERIYVTAWGTVIPAREVIMRPQVNGRVIGHHEALVPGGRLEMGAELVRIDPSDYEMALIESEAELENARFDFEVERGRQIIAKREWDQLRADVPDADANPSLALREPHLRKSEAMVAKAENAIERAKLDLARTRLVAPFNSMVAEESVEVGQVIESGKDICRLVGTDAFWVQTTLPINDLKRIYLPEGAQPGAGVEVYLDTGNGQASPWSGTVVRLLSDLEPNSRMARLLVEVADPLGLQDSSGAGEHIPLLLGSYVRVEIEAGRLDDVLTFPRPSLREGNRLWFVGSDNRIRIATPEVLWTRKETVFVPNVLQAGERLIVSELKAALPGMKVNPQPLEDGGDDVASAR